MTHLREEIKTWRKIVRVDCRTVEKLCDANDFKGALTFAAGLERDIRFLRGLVETEAGEED